MRCLRSGFTLVVLATIAMALMVPSVSHADGVPPATIEVAAAGGTTILAAGTVTGTGFNGGSEGGSEASTATASYDGAGTASVSGNGSTSGGVATANSSGLAEVTVFFEIVQTGGTPGIASTVPLIFTGSDSTSASGPDAEALAYFETPAGQINSCSASGYAVGACGSLPSSNSGSLDYNAAVGALYDMQVVASGSSTLGTGSWSATVDPEVQIDPSWQYASDFTLEVSSNGTPTPTPEPSSIILLGTSLLGLLGVTGMRRRLRLT